MKKIITILSVLLVILIGVIVFLFLKVKDVSKTQLGANTSSSIQVTPTGNVTAGATKVIQHTQNVHPNPSQPSGGSTIQSTEKTFAGLFGITIPYPSTYSYQKDDTTSAVSVYGNEISYPKEIVKFGFKGNTEDVSIYSTSVDGKSTGAGCTSNGFSFTVSMVNGQNLYHITMPRGLEQYCLQNSEYTFWLTRDMSNTVKIDASKIVFPVPANTPVTPI